MDDRVPVVGERVTRVGVAGSSPSLPVAVGRGAAGSRKYGAPSIGRDDPHRRTCVAPNAVAAHHVGGEHQRGARSAGERHDDRRRRRAAEAPREVRRDERDEARSARHRPRRSPPARPPRRAAPSRARSTLVPRARGEVVAELQRLEPAASARPAATSTATASASGQTCSQPRPLSAPTSQTVGLLDARAGRRGSARRRSRPGTAPRGRSDQHEPIAVQPRRARPACNSATARRDRPAERGQRRATAPATTPSTITETPASAAPAVIPMMSGETSGLRARSWNIAPDTPSASPASSAVSARGSRSSSTMKLVAWSPGRRVPRRPHRARAGSRRA